jgi:hypothetical protein
VEGIATEPYQPGLYVLAPEPSTWLLALTGLVGLAVRRRRARSASRGYRGDSLYYGTSDCTGGSSCIFLTASATAAAAAQPSKPL